MRNKERSHNSKYFNSEECDTMISTPKTKLKLELKILALGYEELAMGIKKLIIAMRYCFIH